MSFGLKVWVALTVLCASAAVRAEYKEVWNPPEAKHGAKHVKPARHANGKSAAVRGKASGVSKQKVVRSRADSTDSAPARSVHSKAATAPAKSVHSTGGTASGKSVTHPAQTTHAKTANPARTTVQAKAAAPAVKPQPAPALATAPSGAMPPILH